MSTEQVMTSTLTTKHWSGYGWMMAGKLSTMNTGGHGLNLFCDKLIGEQLLINILITDYRKQTLLVMLISYSSKLLTLVDMSV